MGCWGLVVYATTAAVCSGKTPTLVHFIAFKFKSLNCCILKISASLLTYTPSNNYNVSFALFSSLHPSNPTEVPGQL